MHNIWRAFMCNIHAEKYNCAISLSLSSLSLSLSHHSFKSKLTVNYFLKILSLISFGFIIFTFYAFHSWYWYRCPMTFLFGHINSRRRTVGSLRCWSAIYNITIQYIVFKKQLIKNLLRQLICYWHTHIL